ncbi:MAG: PAS domain-containing protein, partial [Acidobacteria bacterium]|nr:PAS domain-containing protein [Acidobacteriota bacterium]
RLIGTTGVSIDISDRRNDEKARREAETLYLSLVGQLAAVTYVAELGVRGQWLFVSSQIESLLGYSPGEWLADPTNWIRHVHPEDQESVRLAEESALAGNPFRAEYRLFRRDGTMLWVNDSGSLMPGPRGRELLHGVLVDITEQKGLQRRLEHRDRMEAVGRFASGVVHDFNNLLTIISGYSSLLENRLAGGDAQAAREIQRATEHAAALAHQLLAFGRRQTLRPRVLDLNLIVRGLEEMLRRLLAENVELLIRTESNPGLVTADPVQMEQVLINLVVNARDAMPKGGRLTITTGGSAGGKQAAAGRKNLCRPHVTLCVSDTGVGMDRRTRARIFEPFFTTKEAGKGTGLGLATVYGIIKQCGGHIEVESEPGNGTSFRISLPRIDAKTAPPKKPMTSAVARPGSGTILLAEDEPRLRELGRTILSQAGYTVVTAGDAESLGRVMTAHPGDVDLVLTDVVMPEVSGPELVRIAKARWPKARVLYMSGYADDELEDLGRDGEFIQKPFTPAELTVKIAEVLASSH